MKIECNGVEVVVYTLSDSTGCVAVRSKARSVPSTSAMITAEYFPQTEPVAVLFIVIVICVVIINIILLQF